jgi:hypothetical protein
VRAQNSCQENAAAARRQPLLALWLIHMHTCAAACRRSRQQLEQEYFNEWQAMTSTSEEEKNRPVTVLSFLSFLPIWFKFYVVRQGLQGCA